MNCVTCNGSTWVLASTSDGNKLTPCYTCKHAGRPQKPKPPHVIQKLPERFQKLIYAAETNTLGSITLSPGRILNTADKAVLEYAARYALTGSQNCIERLDEILKAVNVAKYQVLH